MSDVMERAARALASLQGADYDARSEMETPGGESPDDMRSGFIDQVRAVLLAVRDPDERMCEAGSVATVDVSGNMSDLIGIGAHKARSSFAAMIDAALTPPPT